MRDPNPLPAWAARQRSRRLTRHGDDKIVRWINLRPLAETHAADGSGHESDGLGAETGAGHKPRAY